MKLIDNPIIGGGLWLALAAWCGWYFWPKIAFFYDMVAEVLGPSATFMLCFLAVYFIVSSLVDEWRWNWRFRWQAWRGKYDD